MKRVAFIILCVGCIESSALSAAGGSTGLTFLKLGVGGRAIAMGEAYSAVAADAAGTYYNPAGLSLAQSDQLMISHKEWIAGTTTEFFGAVIRGEPVTYGVALNSTNVNDIEIRTQPGPPIGTFSAHDFAVSASAAMNWSDAISVGVAGKFLYEKIYLDETSGYAIDVGGMFRYSDALRFGIAVTNFGSMNAFRIEAPTLPAMIRVGGAWNFAPLDDISLLIASDVLQSLKNEGNRIHTGADILYKNTFSIRLGYQFGYDAKNFSTGIGIHYSIFQFDYAYVPFNNTLSNSHIFSLTFLL